MNGRIWDTRRNRILSIGVLLLPCVHVYAGEVNQIQLPWSDLGARTVGRKVAIVLPGGTHIEGKVRGVETDGLRLKVSRTSDRKVLWKGEQLLPRQSVSVLQVTEYRRLGRLLVTAGAAAAAGGIVATA